LKVKQRAGGRLFLSDMLVDLPRQTHGLQWMCDELVVKSKVKLFYSAPES